MARSYDFISAADDLAEACIASWDERGIFSVGLDALGPKTSPVGL